MVIDCEIICLNRQIIQYDCERFLDNDVQRGCYGLFQSIIQVFACRDRGKPQELFSE